jgi:lipoyl-dependent peroxiredoxin
MVIGTGAYEGPYTFASRFESGPGTNPEELIGAANAGCFSMFLAALLTEDGFTPTFVRTSARVHLTDGPTISLIELETEAKVPNLSEAQLGEYAEKAMTDCPASKALAGPKHTVKATLVR